MVIGQVYLHSLSPFLLIAMLKIHGRPDEYCREYSDMIREKISLNINEAVDDKSLGLGLS